MNHGSSIRCWWCSNPCETESALCAPKNKMNRQWRCVGFFCSIGCTKAYMVENKMSIHALKKYLKMKFDIPLSRPLPMAEHWKNMVEFGGNIELPHSPELPQVRNNVSCTRVRHTSVIKIGVDPVQAQPNSPIVLCRKGNRKTNNILNYLT